MTRASASDDDPELAALLADYLARCEEGAPPSPRSFAAGHPALVERFLGAVDALSEIDRAVDELPWCDRLGEYRLLREVGRGGMGIVYEAEQVTLGRRVALKVLPAASMLDHRQVERFEREARAAAGVQHPHIVPVHAIGRDQGVHYYAMQFIEGVSLAAVLEAVVAERRAGSRDTARNLCKQAVVGSSSTGRSERGVRAKGDGSTSRAWFELVASWILQASEAVEHAHREGVLHRDLKPSNLLLDGAGHLWVTDFGLAHMLTAEGELTRSGEFLGTLAYASPEQARGSSASIAPRSDVYSLGVTLYQLMTLRLPFAGSDRGRLMQRILTEEPQRPRRTDPAVPADLETIALKAMAKEPADRYASAAALAADLRAFVDDLPILARPLTAPQRLLRWSRRNRLLAGALFVALLALSIGGLLSYVAWQAMLQRDRAEAAAERATLFRELASADAVARTGRPRQRERSLAHLRSAAERLTWLDPNEPADRDTLRDLRAAAVVALTRWDAREERVRIPSRVRGVALDGSHDYAVLVLEDGTSEVLERATGSLTPLPADALGFPVRAAEFGPDSDLVLLRGDDRCAVVHWPTGRELFASTEHLDGATVAWTARGLVLAIDRDAEAWVGDPDTGAWLPGPGPPDELAHGGRPGRIYPSRDPASAADRILWLSAEDRSPWIWDVGTGTALRLGEGSLEATAMGWHAGGRLVVVGDLAGRLSLFHADTGRVVSSLDVHNGTITRISGEPVGNLFTTYAWDHALRIWTGRLAAPVLELPETPWHGSLVRTSTGPRFGFTIAGEQTLADWELLPPRIVREVHVLSLETNDLPAAGLHAELGLMAMTTRDGVALLEPDTGALLGHVRVPEPLRVEFDRLGSGLWVDSHDGLYVLDLEPTSEGLRFSAPTRVVEGSVTSCSRGSSIFGVVGETAFELDLRERVPRWFEARTPHATIPRISPDGRWLASGCKLATNVFVRERATGSLAARIPANNHARVDWTTTGDLVLMTRGELVELEQESWRELRRMQLQPYSSAPASVLCAPTGELVVLRADTCQVLDARSWELLVEFPVMSRGNLHKPHFSSDGRHLVGASMPGAAQVWDWVEFRHALRELGLDWNPEHPLPTRSVPARARPTLVLPDLPGAFASRDGADVRSGATSR